MVDCRWYEKHFMERQKKGFYLKDQKIKIKRINEAVVHCTIDVDI